MIVSEALQEFIIINMNQQKECWYPDYSFARNHMDWLLAELTIIDRSFSLSKEDRTLIRVVIDGQTQHLPEILRFANINKHHRLFIQIIGNSFIWQRTSCPELWERVHKHVNGKMDDEITSFTVMDVLKYA